jgi:phage shock protein PspC (stress-responsive transcriptional regulator)
MLVGVAAALGRATNTDPVLWRVLFAVMTLVGGVGIIAYLVGWLLIPGEGDTSSPLEALLGRGRSSTSPVIVVLVGIGLLIATGSFLFDGPRHLLLVVALIVGAVLLLNRATGQPRPAAPVPPPPPPPPGPETTEAAGYRPPFAPYGPYASGPYPYPGLATAPAPAPPAPPRSRLGRVTFSLLLVVLGVLALVDIVGHVSVPFAGYVAAALATVGLGLVLGAWFGRARGLIAFGVVLSIMLAIATAAGHANHFRGSTGEVTWTPANLSQLSDRYDHGFGDATLDLSKISFTGVDKQVSLRINAGTVRVLVPPDTDVTAQVKVNVGDADVFGEHWDGVNTPKHTITNEGPDGAGGGHLTLDIQVNAGSLEVTR